MANKSREQYIDAYLAAKNSGATADEARTAARSATWTNYDEVISQNNQNSPLSQMLASGEAYEENGRFYINQQKQQEDESWTKAQAARTASQQRGETGEQWYTGAKSRYDAASKLLADLKKTKASNTEIEEAAKRLAEAEEDYGYSKYFRFSDITNDKDYQSYIDKGKSILNGDTGEVSREKPTTLGGRIMDFFRRTGEIYSDSNIGAMGSDLPMGVAVRNYANDDSDEKINDKTWSEDEKNTYLYLLGRDGEQTARDYAIEINSGYAQQERQKQQQAITDWSQKNAFNGVLGTVASVAASASPMGIVDFLNLAAEYVGKGRISQKDYLTPTEMSTTVQSAIATSLNEKYGTIDESKAVVGGKGWGDAYQLASSVMTSWASIGLGGQAGSLAFFFGNAASQGVQEALDRGLAPEKAVALGFCNGLAEVLGEKFSVDNLINMKSSRTLGQFLKSIGVQAGIEGSEEGFTTFLNTLADNLINGDMSEYNQKVNALMGQGMSYDEAKKQALKESVNDLAFDILGGAISGGLSATGGSFIQNMSYNGDSQLLFDTAKQVGTDKEVLRAAQIERAVAESKNGQLKRGEAGELMGIIENNEGTETYYKNATAKAAIDSVAKDLNLSNAQKAVLMDGYEAGDADAQTYALGVREAYKLGTLGLSLEQATEQAKFGADLNETQFRHAWQLGAGQKTTESNAVDVKTPEGKEQLASALSMLGEHAQAAADAYDGKQDVSRFAAAMNKAANLYAANGVDVKALAQELQESGSKDIISYLSEEQLETAAKIGAQIRAQNAAEAKKSSEGLTTLRQQADAIVAAGNSGAQALNNIDKAIAAASKYGQQEYSLYKEKLEALEEMVKVDPEAENTEAYQKAYEEAEQHYQNATEARKSIDDLEEKRKELQSQQPVKRKKGTVSFEGGTDPNTGKQLKAVDQSKLTKHQKNVVSMVEALADIINIDYVFFDGDSNTGGEYIGDGVIYININSGVTRNFAQGIAAASLSHELTHFMQEYAPEEYNELKDFIVSEIMKKSPSEFDALVKQQLAWQPDLTYAQAVDEVIANSCQNMLLNSQYIAQFAREHMTAAEKIKDTIHDIVGKIKAAYEGIDFKSDQGPFHAVQAVIDQSEMIQKRWDKALEAATKNYNAEQIAGNQQQESSLKAAAQTTGVKYQKIGTREDGIEVYETSKETRSLTWAQRKQAFIDLMAGEYRNRKARFKRNGHIYYASFEDVDIKKNVYGDDGSDKAGHGAKINAGADGDILNLVDGAKWFGGGKETGKPGKAHEGVVYWDYFLKTVQIDNKVFDLLANIRRKPGGAFVYNLELYERKEIEAASPRSSSTEKPSHGAPTASADNVPENGAKVKKQMQQWDSSGKELSTQQQNYFADSKIRDADGRLKVMYRGGSGDFTVFDRSKSKYSNLYGRGFYFTDSKEHAGQYGKARAFYLNITNPLQQGTKTFTQAQIRLFLREVSANEDYGLENYGYGATVDSVLKSLEGKDDYGVLTDINAACIGDLVAAAELFNEVNGTNIDGIVVPTETVAFRADQIKLTDNENPTKNTDIRYQQWDSEGAKLSKKQEEYFKDSKIRDEDGNLIPVYHGTEADFTVFDRTKSRANMDIQGNFFSPWELDAQGYGSKVGVYYLNIKNPAPESVAYKALNRFKGQNGAGIKAREYLESLGYDGVNNSDEEYIAFNPEQIKLTSNKNPTENEDIRYQKWQLPDQISLDEWLNGGVKVDESLHPRIRNLLNRAAATEQNVKDYFSQIPEDSEYYLSPEDIDDMMEVNPYGSAYDGYMYNVEQIVQNLSDLSKEQYGKAKEQTYELMEELLGYMSTLRSSYWKEENLSRNQTFTEWYSQKHPSMYYPGYVPGQLDTDKEETYLRNLIASGRLHGEELDYAKRLHDAMNSPARNSYYQKWDSTADDTAYEAEGRELAYARIQSENKALSDTVAALKKLTGKQENTIAKLEKRLKLTKTQEVRESDAKRLANQLIRDNSSVADKARIAADLKALGDYILQTDAANLSEDEIKQRARAIASEIVENAEAVSDLGGELATWQSIASDLKGRKLTIDTDFLGDLDVAGGYEAFRKQNFGNFTLAKRETGEARADYKTVGEAYMEMQQSWGKAYFPDVANEGEQIRVMADMFQRAKGTIVNPNSQYMGEATEALANQIAFDVMDGILRPTEPTTADKYKARTDALKEQIAQLKKEGALSDKEADALRKTVYDLTMALDKAESRYTSLRVSADVRTDQLRAEGIARAAEIKANERARAEKQIAALKDHYKEVSQRARDRREENAGAAKYRKQIDEKAKKLYEMLMKNSDKEHIPEVLKGPLADFLTTLDFSSKRLLRGGEETKRDVQFGARLMQLQQLLAGQQDYINGNGDGNVDLGGYIDVSPESLDFLKEAAQQITASMATGNEYTINQMSADQLRSLSNFLSSITKAIKNMNNFMANERFADVREAASQDIEQMDKYGKARERDNSSVLKFLSWKEATPYYVFRRFGKCGVSIFDGLTKGWEKMAFNVQQVIDFTEKLYNSKEVNEWKSTMHDITLEDGSEIKMTTAQLMELSMLLNREQALRHIEKGGIRVGDITTKKGKLTDVTHYHLTGNDIQNMLKILNGRQMEVAKALQTFMATKGAEWGNEISMRRFGYNFYTEGENYFPIKTDANDRPMADTDAQQNSMFRLLNLSSSKSLNPKASNALIVGDIFDTFSDHMADQAKLNGLGLPILDAIKWFNFKERIDLEEGGYNTRTLQASMEQAFGDEAQRYFRTLMKDVNGVREGGDRSTGVVNKLVSNFKVASVAANFRVALLQPTSYLRASFLIDPKYLAAAFTKKNAYKEAMKYSGTAVWKSLGYFDTNIARNMRDQIQHNDSWKDNLVEGSMYFAELGDKLTWGRLWVACKMQTQAQNKGLSGEELNQKTADLFREVVYSSQVMDGTLTRSEIMRSSTAYDKLVTAFMAEPTLSYNILMDAASQYSLDVRANGKANAWSRNGKTIGKAFMVYAASAALAAFAESVWDAVRDDDDEEFWKKFWQAFFGEKDGLQGLLDGNIEQDLWLITKIPYVKDIVSLLSGYKQSNMATDAVSNLINAFRIWRETYQLSKGEIDKATELTYWGRMTPWGKIYKTMQSLSQLSGIPASGAFRDVFAIWNTLMNGRKDDWKIRTYDSNMLSQKKKEAFNEYVKGVGISENQYRKILREVDTNENGSVTQAELSEYLKAQLDAGSLTKEQSDAIWDAQGWQKTYDQYTGADKQKKETPAPAATAKPVTTPAPKAKLESVNPEDTKQSSGEKITTYEQFKKNVRLYSDKKDTAYQLWESTVKPLGIDLDTYTRLLNDSDTNGNNSVTQDELGVTLYKAIQKKEISDGQASAIWYTLWNGGRSKTYDSWAAKTVTGT